MPPPAAPGLGGASQQQPYHHPPRPRGSSATTTNSAAMVGASFSKPSEKERVLVRYLLEQPSFGVDGDVPPDALDAVVSSRGGGRDEEDEGEDFAEEEEKRDDADGVDPSRRGDVLKAGDHSNFQHQADSDGQLMCLRLSGETVSGECLSVAGGETVSGSCTYQWQRVVPVSGGIESIVGAVGPSYVTNDRDIGCHIRVIVRMRRRRTTNESSGAGRTSNGHRRNKSEGYHRPVIAHATTDATVVAAVSSKHPDDERMLASDATGEGKETTRNDFGGAGGGEKAALALTTNGSTPKSASTPISEKNDYCENNSGEKGSKEVSRDDTAARSRPRSPTLLTPNETLLNGTTVAGKNVAHSALLNNLLMKNGAETANGKNNSPSALSPNLSSNNLNNYSSGGEESFHRRRRKEILLNDRADSLIHGPGSESRLAFIRGKELEAKASELFRKVSDAEKMKRTKELLEEEGEERDENDEDGDGEEHAKKKSNGNTRGYSEWDSNNDRSDNAGDECDDEFSEDQSDGHNDIGDDSSAENGMDRGNSVENLSLGSLQAERVARKAKEAYEEAAMKGYPDAMQMLGRCYENGFGTRKDIFKAVEWYEKAEKLGCDEAACDLGCLYYLGRLPRDELKKRTQLVHFTDSSLSKVLSNKGDDFQIQLAKDRKKAFSLFRHAAANGSGPGANNVAMCYEEGQGGVERNWREAARWYAIAARRGVLSAHASLGYALLTLGNRLSAKEAFETGTQHGSRECAEGLRLIREAEKHAANSRKHLCNGGSNNDAIRHSKSDPENERGSTILDIVKQLEKELEKYHELSRRLYNAASLHPESLEEANAVLLSAFPDMNVSSSNASLL